MHHVNFSPTLKGGGDCGLGKQQRRKAVGGPSFTEAGDVSPQRDSSYHKWLPVAGQGFVIKWRIINSQVFGQIAFLQLQCDHNRTRRCICIPLLSLSRHQGELDPGVKNSETEETDSVLQVALQTTKYLIFICILLPDTFTILPSVLHLPECSHGHKINQNTLLQSCIKQHSGPYWGMNNIPIYW